MECLIFEFQIPTSVHMARLTGLEPAAYRVGVCRSIQLGYKRIFGFTLWCGGAPYGGRCAAIRKTAGALRA